MSDIIEVTSWVGIIQGTLLILLLVTRDNNKNANKLLALFIGVITLDCLEPLIFNKNFSGWVIDTWEFLWGGIIFLHGPLQFLYVKKITTTAKIFERSDLKHYTTPIIYYATVVTALIIPFSPLALDIGTVVLHELFLLHLIVYSVLSLRILKKYQNDLDQVSSALKNINLSWLKTLLLTTLCLYLTSSLTAQIQLIDTKVDLTALHMLIQIILVVIMYTISYKSIAQPQIFTEFEYATITRESKSDEKYRTSSLDHENAIRIREKLQRLMEDKKPFLDPNLSLESLAAQLGESKYHVSQVLNDQFKQKFSDFINKYRVEEFKHLILKPRRRKPTVENLAKLSGFNSKASFHSVFKKVTGKTPKKFYQESITLISKESQ